MLVFLFEYQLSYKNIMLLLYQGNEEEKAFMSECYNFINGKQNRTTVKKCFNHIDKRYLLCCHLGIPPSKANNGRILVLGSAGKIGLALTEKLKEKDLKFVEIRGRLHFDLNNSQIYEIFDTINITHVFDLVKNEEGEKLHEQIYSYFDQKGIIVTRVVDEKIDQKYDQIISPQPFGNQYMRYGVSRLFNSTFYCINENKCNKTESFSVKKKFALSTEIAIELLNALTHTSPKIIKPKFHLFSEQEIWNSVIKYQHKKLDKNNKLYPVFNSIHQSHQNRLKKPYLSIGYLTSNDEEHYNKALNTLKIYEKVLKLYPDINLEIIFFWIKKYSSLSFIEYMNKTTIKRFHVIEISNETYQFIAKKLKTDFIPEYYFRDISLRLSKGDLLFTGSSDVFPSPSFFEIVQRKLIGPFTILKSLRINASKNIDDSFLHYYTQQKTIWSYLAESMKICDFGYYSVLGKGDLGDLQGALKSTIFHVNGWIFDKYTWAVDSVFVWDIMMFEVPFYIQYMFNSQHQFHIPISQDQPRFNINRRYKKTNMLLCNGIPTKNMKDYVRDDWGISYNFFDISKKKFGHILYNIKPIDTKSVNFNLSKLDFDVIYDDNKNLYN